MKRLVKKEVTKLDEEQTMRLFDLVTQTIGLNTWFVDNCEKWKREIHKRYQDPLTEEIDPNDPRVYVNFPWAYIQTTGPNLFFRDPYLQARPNHPDRTASAESWEQLLNAILRRTDYKNQTEMIVRDALYYAEGWGKWVYSDNTPDEELSGEADLGSTTGDISGEGTQTETPYDGPVSWDHLNAPVKVRLCPYHVFPDSPTRKLEDSRFVVVRYRRFVRDLIADGRYPNIKEDYYGLVEHKNVPVYNRPSQAMDPMDLESAADAMRDPQVWVYEVWINQLTDLGLYKTLAVFVEHMEDKLAAPLRPWRDLYGPHMHSFPFTKLELIPVPDGNAVSPLESWFNLNRVFSTVVSRIVAMTNRLNLKYVMSTANMQKPSDAEAKLLSSRAIEVIHINQPDVGNKVVPVDQPRVPSELYQLMQMMKALQTEVSGLSQNQRGGAGVRTATEAAVIDRSYQMRTDAMVDQVEDMIRRDADIMIRMLRTVVDSDFVFRRVGETGGVKWGEFTREDAEWSPDVEVEPSSFRKAEFDAEAQRYMQALNIGAQLAQSGVPVRLDIIYNKLLKRMEIPEADKVLGDPVDATTKQLEEVIAMVLGMPAEVSPDDDHKVHLQALDHVMSTEAAQAFSPQTRFYMEQHRAQHEAILQGKIQNAPQISQTGGMPTNSTASGFGYGGEPQEGYGGMDIGAIGSAQI